MNAAHKKKLAASIVEKLRAKGHTAYFAGGCVRDLILKTPPNDYDVATDASADEVEKLFSKTVPVGKQFGVMLVIIDGIQFEVATFRQEGGYADGRRPSWVKPSSPEEDAQRRDFTVNGLFLDPVTDKIIDYVGGEADIRSKIVRTIGPPSERFNEDKLRLIRAVRFASTLGFEIEKNTWETLREMASQIQIVSRERIRDELIKMFTRPNAGRAFQLLYDSGLMKEVLPEVQAMKGCEQSPEYHPEGDVFIHTRMLMDKLDRPSVILAFSALLHDVGKPPTFSREGGKIHFYEHERVGAEMAREILTRLRFSNKEIDAICASVENHMRFMHVQVMREGKLKNFLSRDTFQEELELHRIDCQSSHGKLDNYDFLREKIKHYKAEELKPRPLLSGNDLLEAGLQAGPRMGQVLRDIYEQQLEGKLRTKEDALKWARMHWKDGAQG